MYLGITEPAALLAKSSASSTRNVPSGCTRMSISDVAECLAVKNRREIEIAVIALQQPTGRRKAKDIEPAVEPIIFRADCATSYDTY